MARGEIEPRLQIALAPALPWWQSLGCSPCHTSETQSLSPGTSLTQASSSPSQRPTGACSPSASLETQGQRGQWVDVPSDTALHLGAT